MDSQINKVHSLTIFCVALSDLMGFWEASISPFRSEDVQKTKTWKTIIRELNFLRRARLPEVSCFSF